MITPRRYRVTSTRTRRPESDPGTSHHDSWWPWSPSLSGDASCPESAVLLDALRRRLTVTGVLRSCCVQKLSRVLDFVLTITPGDTSIDVTGVTLLEPAVARVVRDWTDRLAARNLQLSIVGASPAVVHALEL